MRRLRIKHWFIIVFVSLFVLRAIASTDSQPTPQPATPPQKAPPYMFIRSTLNGMTEAQQSEYINRLIGQQAQAWHGYIDDVSAAGIVEIDMDAPGELLSATDVTLRVPDGVAASLRKNSIVVFTGTIRDIDVGLGVTVRLSDATVTPTTQNTIPTR